MSLVYAAAGFAVGFFVGIGGALFYLRWKMKQQVGMMQENMEDLMDMNGEMQDFPAIDDEEMEEKEE